MLTRKLLATNGAGLLETLPAVARYGPDLLEFTRDHQKQRQNDRIMRFRPGAAIGDQALFEQTLAAARARLPVQLAAVTHEAGVHSLRCVRAYADWATAQGVTHIMLRESADASARDRVPMTRLLEELLREPNSAFEPVGVVVGSHHYAVRARFGESAIVNFEVTDHGALRARQTSGVLQKLCFHPNGNLCGGSDPHKQVLMRTQPN